MISIHAPAKGATTQANMIATCHINFNPRSREGSDTLKKRFTGAHFDFNPRSREGSD